ncbi:hypothetical protein [Clostridium peptidivorans]|nr:hypothetical protein [Clostridium peptidivorans]
MGFKNMMKMRNTKMKKGNPMNGMTNGMEKGVKKLVDNIKKIF